LIAELQFNNISDRTSSKLFEAHEKVDQPPYIGKQKRI